MQLGKAKKANEFLESLAKEGEAVELEAPKAAGGGPAAGMGGAVAPTARAASEPCSIDIEEKLSVQLNKEGGVENLEVQGTMSLVSGVCGRWGVWIGGGVSGVCVCVCAF